MKTKKRSRLLTVILAGFIIAAYFGCSDNETLPENDDYEIIYGDGVTDIDGNYYVTVIIGDQEWMAENLRVSKYNSGDAIPAGLDDAEWKTTTSGAYAIYPHGGISGLNSDAEVVAAYGKLYNWYAVDNSRGLCPEGWRVATDAEWTEMVDYVVYLGFLNAGIALRSCRHVGSPFGDDCNTWVHPRWINIGLQEILYYGYDAVGFSALPGASRSSEGEFSILFGVGYFGNWWSATERSGSHAWYWRMSSMDGDVSRPNSGTNKRGGRSVRCVRNIE